MLLSNKMETSLLLFYSSSLIALHAQQPQASFRQRDIRFYMELFINWAEYAGSFRQIRLHNTQISRVTKQFSDKGHLKQKHSTQEYELTAIGLAECLRNIFLEDISNRYQYLFFKIYFLSNYAPRIRDLMATDRRSIPLGLKIEIEPLLDTGQLIRDALSQANKDKNHLEQRIQDAEKMPELVRKLLKNNTKWNDIVLAVEKVYPYELNSMKSLSELCSTLSEETVRWELTEGSIHRSTEMWRPQLRMLCNYISELNRLIDAGSSFTSKSP